MKTPIEQRVLTVTDYMVSHNATVRATAEYNGPQNLDHRF